VCVCPWLCCVCVHRVEAVSVLVSFQSVCTGWISVWDVVRVFFCCMAGCGLCLWWLCVVFAACVVVVFVWGLKCVGFFCGVWCCVVCVLCVRNLFCGLLVFVCDDVGVCFVFIFVV